jgi:hypothetical protein
MECVRLHDARYPRPTLRVSVKVKRKYWVTARIVLLHVDKENVGSGSD